MSRRGAKRGLDGDHHDDREEEEEEEDGEDQPHRSRDSGKQKQKKRRGGVAGSDEDGIDGASWEQDGDETESEEDEEAAALARFERQQQKELEGAEDNSLIETGVILRVYMENFMCHRLLDLELGKHVNFITGDNGSGKSAIVAAIQLCLGSSARRTGRGDALGKLVREGSSLPAVVRVTLLNTGVDAYRPDVYGGKITIERRIPRSGAASYRLLDERLKLVTTEKRELDRILKEFNIYVDNPCCVLTQEESKKFIGGQEREKYQFFLKATGLERIFEELESVRLTLEKTKETQQMNKTKITMKHEVVVKLESELRELMALDKYDDQIAELAAKCFWCDVSASRAAAAQIEKDLSIATAKLDRIVSKLESQQATLAEFGSTEAIERRVQELNEELGAAVQALQSCEQRSLEATRNATSAEARIKNLSNYINDFNGRLQGCEAELQRLADASANAASKGEQRVSEMLKAAIKKKAEIEARMEALKRSRQEVSEEADRLQEQSAAAAYRVRELRFGLGGKEKQRAAMSGESRGNDRSGMFGAKVPAILSDIQKTRFRGRVIGPLGLHLRLTDVIEASGAETAVERSMGMSLRSFLVTNGEDRAALAAILRRHNAYSEHSITVQAPRPRYNVQRIKDAITVLDLIQFPPGDDDIFNAIIDQQKIDQILVVSNEEECMRRYVIRDGRGQENLIPGCRQAVTYNGTVIRFRAGNRASEIMREPVRHLLVADLTASIRSLDAEIAADREAVEAESKAAARLESQRREATAALDENGRKMQSATRELASAVRDIRDFEEQLAEAKVNSNIDTSHLEAERQELLQALGDVQTKLDVERERFQAAQAADKEAKAQRTKSEQGKNKILQKIRDQEREIEQFVERQEVVQRDIEKLESARAAQQTECDNLERRLEHAQAQLARLTDTAMAETGALLGDKWDNQPLPIDRKDSRAALEASIAALKAKVEVERREAGLRNRTKAGVTAELQSASEEFEDMKGKYLEIRDQIKKSEKNLNDRLLKWQMQLKYLEKSVAKNFDSYLQKKAYAGTVKFNHAEKLLHLETQTDNFDENTQCSDVRQLSGGERSYTTLSLLLALGLVIECPFRLMDEYDVFLDQVSRKITLMELQKYALEPEQRGRQFIIITPQDLHGIVSSSTVKHLRMPAPERRARSAISSEHQTTLDESGFEKN